MTRHAFLGRGRTALWLLATVVFALPAGVTAAGLQRIDVIDRRDTSQAADPPDLQVALPPGGWSARAVAIDREADFAYAWATRPSVSVSRLVVLFGPMCVAAVIAFVAAALIWRFCRRPVALSEEAYRVCRTCGYRLTGAELSCPECGVDIQDAPPRWRDPRRRFKRLRRRVFRWGCWPVAVGVVAAAAFVPVPIQALAWLGNLNVRVPQPIQTRLLARYPAAASEKAALFRIDLSSGVADQPFEDTNGLPEHRQAQVTISPDGQDIALMCEQRPIWASKAWDTPGVLRQPGGLSDIDCGFVMRRWSISGGRAIDSGRLITEFRPLAGHRAWQSGDGQFIAPVLWSGTGRSHARVWDLQASGEVTRFENPEVSPRASAWRIDPTHVGWLGRSVYGRMPWAWNDATQRIVAVRFGPQDWVSFDPSGATDHLAIALPGIDDLSPLFMGDHGGAISDQGRAIWGPLTRDVPPVAERLVSNELTPVARGLWRVDAGQEAAELVRVYETTTGEDPRIRGRFLESDLLLLIRWRRVAHELQLIDTASLTDGRPLLVDWPDIDPYSGPSRVWSVTSDGGYLIVASHDRIDVWSLPPPADEASPPIPG